MNPNANSPLVVIGPDPLRFQGGIALFSGELVAALSMHRRIEFRVWNRPYPSFRKKGSPENISGKSRTELDLFSRKSWEDLVQEIRSENPQGVLLNWVHPIQALPFHHILSGLKGLSTWVICHNVLPHEVFPFSQSLTRLALKEAEGLVVHGENSEETARSLFPDKKILRLFLPPLGNSHYGKPHRSLQSSEEISLLCFGHIRPYKGIEILFEAFSQFLITFPNAKLRIVGKPLSGSLLPGAASRYVNTLKQKIQELGLENSISMHLEYCSEEELKNYFSSSTLAVFPFLHVSSSASIVTALSAGIPVVASRLPGLSDCVVEGENGFLAEAGNARELSEALIRGVRTPLSGEKVRASVASRSWSRYAEAIIERI